MADSEDLHARLDRLQAEIDAAMASLERRKHLEWADIGSVLSGLSTDIEEIREQHSHDHAAGHAKADRVQEKLGEAKRDVPDA